MADSAEALKKYEAEAVELISSYDRISENVLSAEKNVAEITAAVGSVTDADIGEYEFYLKKLEKAAEILNNSEKEVNKIKRRIDDIIAASSKLIKAVTEYNEKKKQATDEFDLLRKSVKDEADKLMKEVHRLKAGLPDEIISAYRNLRNEKRLPPFVRLVNKNECSGCGMDVPYDVLSKLSGAGWYAECPNCRRFLYVK